MNKCKNCKILTRNKKFCSLSCSASFNNRGKRRHGSSPTNCLNCGETTRSSRNKYCSNHCQWEYTHKQTIHSGSLNGKDMKTIKKILLKYRKHKCELCKKTHWNKKPIPLTIHHINGYSNDNRLNNLIVLCWNCHAQTPTFGIKNRGKGRRFLDK